MTCKNIPAVGDRWLASDGQGKWITAVVKSRNSCPSLDIKAAWCIFFSDGTYDYIDEDDIDD